MEQATKNKIKDNCLQQCTILKHVVNKIATHTVNIDEVDEEEINFDLEELEQAYNKLLKRAYKLKSIIHER